jgi:acyl carrier protein
MLDRVNLTDRLIELVKPFAPGLSASDPAARDARLSEAGLTSMAAVRFMLAIEAEFGVAIPDAELTPTNFANLASIEALLERLRAS